MKKFNPIENKIALFLSKSPKLKNKIKKVYQKINYLIYSKKYNKRSDFNIKEVDFPSNMSVFWGYYDKSPINISNKYLAFNSTNSNTKNKPNNNDVVFINIMSLETKEIIFSERIYAFNWQQGSKSQWLSENRLIYNTFENENYISKIIDIDTEHNISVKKLDIAIYDCYADIFALSLSFERLSCLRPDYGYFSHKLVSSYLCDEDDGIFYIDIVSGNSELYLSFCDLLNEFPIKDKSLNIKHKINHIMISPKGDKAMFLHRYYINDERFDRLFIMEVKTKRLKMIADEKMVSHCFWIDNDTIIGYLRYEKIDSYYKLTASFDKEIKFYKFEPFSFLSDGHPSSNKYGDIITDTYPDKSRMKNLYVYMNKDNKVIHLGEFFESMDWYGESRCDLHPRFSMDGKTIYFDSVHENCRKLYYLELKR